MHTPPSIPYSGLTFILDEPSRFDKEFGRLLSGPARDWLNHDVLPAQYTIDSCDIRDLSSLSAPFLPGTRKIVLGGKRVSMHFHAQPDPPGYLTFINSIPAVPVFFPQDCCDYRNIRGHTREDESAATDRDAKEVTPTLYRNHRFWTSWHIRKLLNPNPLPTYPKIDIHAYPNLDQQIKILNSINNEHLYLDIETSRTHRCLSCIGWSSDSHFPKIYVLPVYLSTGRLAYSDFHRLHRALSLALTRNCVVAHNGSFDLAILHAYYKFCLPNDIYDTMVGQHRCFLEAEKSLGHTIPTWTNQPYHKDFNTDVYSHDDERRLWTYNGWDVYSLKPIMEAQLRYAETIPGLTASINQGNASILPYLDTNLLGMRMNLMKVAETQRRLRKHQALYAKVASFLVGKTFNPGSTQQCAKFFHDTLNYPVQEKSLTTGAPALGSKQLYQLLVKYDNPVLHAVLKYRETAKDASMLESELWRMP